MYKKLLVLWIVVFALITPALAQYFPPGGGGSFSTTTGSAVPSQLPVVAVQCATITVLPTTPVYSNGAGTITAGSNAALTVDGYVVLLGDRVLVKNQASTFQNGIYTET